MSYCRWSNSDLYVYASCNNFYLCFLCPDGGNDGAGGYRTLTGKEMADHVQAHIDNGSTVPPYTIPALLKGEFDDEFAGGNLAEPWTDDYGELHIPGSPT